MTESSKGIAAVQENAGKRVFYLVLVSLCFFALTLLVQVAFAADRSAAVNVSAEIRNLKDTRPYQRLRAVQKLGKTKDVVATREMAQQLKNEKNENVRSAMVVSLGEIGNADAVQALRATCLNESESVDLRLEALEGLSRRRDSTVARDTLRGATADKNPVIRRTALGLLWHTADPGPEIRQMIGKAARDDSDADVRRSAQEMLEFKPKG
jgi:HEAT repeat protein